MNEIISNLEDYQRKGLVFKDKTDDKVVKIIQSTRERKTILISREFNYTLELQDISKPVMLEIYERLDEAEKNDEQIIIDTSFFPGFLGNSELTNFWYDLDKFRVKENEENFDFSLNVSIVAESSGQEV